MVGDSWLVFEEFGQQGGAVSREERATLGSTPETAGEEVKLLRFPLFFYAGFLA